MVNIVEESNPPTYELFFLIDIIYLNLPNSPFFFNVGLS